MTANNIIFVIGWFFLIMSFVWPLNKWGGRVIKIAFSALATGVFLANMIYSFL